VTSEKNGKGRKKAFSSPTIYDIAQLAGVNPSTVSRALNNPGRINAVTEARIKEAAKQLNYQVNPFARALPTGRTKMIAMIVADITNPMFFNAVRGAEEVAANHGYTLVIAESQESSALEATAVERILPSVDGVIFATTRLGDDQILSLAERKPIVLLSRKIEGLYDVVPDVLPGIVTAVSHLADLGHKYLAFASGPTKAWMSDHRWKLIMNEAVSRGLKVVEIGPNEPTVAGGIAAADYIMASGVTAVITYNDLMAIGLANELRARAIEVPGRISIIGFDDIFGSDFTTPRLTTIKSPLQDSGAAAVEILLNQLEETEVTINTQDFKTELILRDSTAAA
jgi:LacI family transcriptional regulator